MFSTEPNYNSLYSWGLCFFYINVGLYGYGGFIRKKDIVKSTTIWDQKDEVNITSRIVHRFMKPYFLVHMVIWVTAHITECFSHMIWAQISYPKVFWFTT